VIRSALTEVYFRSDVRSTLFFIIIAILINFIWKNLTYSSGYTQSISALFPYLLHVFYALRKVLSEKFQIIPPHNVCVCVSPCSLQMMHNSWKNFTFVYKLIYEQIYIYIYIYIYIHSLTWVWCKQYWIYFICCVFTHTHTHTYIYIYLQYYTFLM
jgi:hypothetical protein